MFFVPVLSLGVTALACFVYVYLAQGDQLLVGADMSCFNGYNVLSQHQLYRIVTSNFVHLNFQELLGSLAFFNLIAAPLERSIRLRRFLCTLLWSALLTSVINIASARLLIYYFDEAYAILWNTCYVGLSGTTFALSVSHVKILWIPLLKSTQGKILFWLLPLVGACATYWLPEVSVFCNVSGVLAGYVLVLPCFNRLTEPCCFRVENAQVDMKPEKKEHNHHHHHHHDPRKPALRPAVHSLGDRPSAFPRLKSMKAAHITSDYMV